MKKSKILKIVLVIVAILLILLAIDLFRISLQKKNGELKENYYPPANQAGKFEDPNVKKIKIEILSEEERTKAGFGSRLADPADVQVISRDENGKITSYRKIYKPEDIVDSVYDPDGTRTAGMAIETNETDPIQ